MAEQRRDRGTCWTSPTTTTRSGAAAAEEVGGAADHGGTGDGAAFGGELLAGCALHLDTKSAGVVELGLERREVDLDGLVGVGFGWGIPPGAGFGEPRRATGGRVDRDMEQGASRVLGGPTADGEIKRGEQVGREPSAERLAGR